MENVLQMAACTLPTAIRPLRLREFDEFLATAVVSVKRDGPGRISCELVPTPDVAATAASLLVRETACCSFFRFDLLATAGRLTLEVTVPQQHAGVLEAVLGKAREPAA